VVIEGRASRPPLDRPKENHLQHLSYDESYSRSPAYFGTAPDSLLADHLALIEREEPLLDVGAGQGRNAFYLAGLGYRVDALEPSADGATQISAAAARNGLTIGVINQRFEDFRPPGHYGAVLVFGLIPDLTRGQVMALLKRIGQWVAPGGLAFVTGFTTEDPSFASWSSLRQVGRTSFEDPRGRIRTFLEPGELLQLARQFEAIVCNEGIGPEHRHGEGPLERHARFEAVLRRR
jgi:2-polyprenyl-3-methyl-5-hydroxy-6-metoxy-1,4-benzoquinol methylase